MGLESFIVECLSARGISTAKDLLETSPLALMVYLDLSLADANKIISHVSSKIAFARNSTALELLRARSQQNLYLRTGLKELDTAMRGGLNIGTISEICGPPGRRNMNTILIVAVRTKSQIFAFSWNIFDGSRPTYSMLFSQLILKYEIMILAFSSDLNNILSLLIVHDIISNILLSCTLTDLFKVYRFLVQH
jgi:Rad51